MLIRHIFIMFKMTDLIILAKQFVNVFFEMAPFLTEVGNMAPSVSKLE